MQNLAYEDVENIFLVLFSLVFIILEKYFPKNPELAIREQLKEDIQAFVVLVLGVSLSRLSIMALFNHYDVASVTRIESSSDWPFIIRLLLAHLTTDFFLYWIHRAMHKNDFLWKTHQWHHSADKLYWFSGFRTSLMHAFIYAIPQVFVGFYLYKFTPIEMGIGFGLGVISNLFTHSNVAVPSWLPLHWFIVTPDFHHPHHSQMGTQQKNFGNVFSIWDRLFGTYVDPKIIKKDFKYGLKEKRSNLKMMIGL